MRKPAAALVAVLLALAATACGSSDDGGKQTLTVFAAASLTQSFGDIAQQFAAAHEGVRVRFSFGGSADLAEQIEAGAPADVFASADTRNMDKLGATAVDPRDFASNTLEIAVPPGNPARITDLQDLAKPDVKLVTCAPEVPCGSAAQTVAHEAGLTLEPVSQEQSVTDVLGKVSTGEADAGLVYVTDVKAAGGKVEGITFPESSTAVNTYPLSVLEDSKHRRLAQEFVDFVLSPRGQKVLADDGFAKP